MGKMETSVIVSTIKIKKQLHFLFRSFFLFSRYPAVHLYLFTLLYKKIKYMLQVLAVLRCICLSLRRLI